MAQVTLGSQIGFATDVNLHSHNISRQRALVGPSPLTDCCMLLSIMLDIDAPHNAITRKVTED